jgi:hypothetical protein
VRGTLSQSRLTLPASAVGSARTLGSTHVHRCGFNKKCACRREPNSHNAAKPRAPLVRGVLRRSAPAQQPQKTQNLATQLVRRRLPKLVRGVVGSASRQAVFCREAPLPVSSLARRFRGGFGFARLCWRRRENCQRSGGSSRVSLRQLSQGRLLFSQNVVLRRTVLPNPSLEPTRYGRQRKPGLRHLVHHLSPGLRRLPPRSAQLER